MPVTKRQELRDLISQGKISLPSPEPTEELPSKTNILSPTDKIESIKNTGSSLSKYKSISAADHFIDISKKNPKELQHILLTTCNNTTNEGTYNNRVEAAALIINDRENVTRTARPYNTVDIPSQASTCNNTGRERKETPRLVSPTRKARSDYATVQPSSFGVSILGFVYSNRSEPIRSQKLISITQERRAKSSMPQTPKLQASSHSRSYEKSDEETVNDREVMSQGKRQLHQPEPGSSSRWTHSGGQSFNMSSMQPPATGINYSRETRSDQSACISASGLATDQHPSHNACSSVGYAYARRTRPVYQVLDLSRPQFSYINPHPLTNCWLPTCQKPTSSHDECTVICPRCDAFSYVRYCSPTHLHLDMRRHYIEDCTRRINLMPYIDEDTIDPKQQPLQTFIPATDQQHDSFERHRQAIYQCYPPSQDSPGDYYIFSDADVLLSREKPPLSLTPDILAKYRGRGTAVGTVEYPAKHSFKEQFAGSLQHMLSLGVSAATVAPAECGLLVIWIRGNLKERGMWDEMMVDRVCLAMQLEFGYKVDPRLWDS